jgi:hypothetical protein
VEIERKKDIGRGWVVYWYPLEIIMMNRTSALRIDLNENGTYQARRIFFKRCKLENANTEI